MVSVVEGRDQGGCATKRWRPAPLWGSLVSPTYVGSKSLARFCCEFLNLQHLAESAFSKLPQPNEAQSRQAMMDLAELSYLTPSGSALPGNGTKISAVAPCDGSRLQRRPGLWSQIKCPKTLNSNPDNPGINKPNSNWEIHTAGSPGSPEILPVSPGAACNSRKAFTPLSGATGGRQT